MTDIQQFHDREYAKHYLIDRYIPVLDEGFVALKDFMGGDHDIVEAARTSFGFGTKSVTEDRDLLRYLFRHRHSTPFEMCLHGDTEIWKFVKPGSRATAKKKTIRELAESFETGGRASSGAKLYHVRTVSPVTGVVASARIKRAWKSGRARCLKITVATGFTLRCTGEHPLLLPDGTFLKAKDLMVGDALLVNGRPALKADVEAEICVRRGRGEYLVDIASSLALSHGVVHKVLKKHGMTERLARRPHLRKSRGTHADPRAIARKVKAQGGCEIVGCASRARTDVHHKDEDPHNNSQDNLVRLCAKHHRVLHGSTPTKVFPTTVVSIEDAGEHDVYDLEVDDANHTFVADGFAVHNCELKFHVKLPIFVARQLIRHRTASVNEYSLRYSLAPLLFYMPEYEVFRKQSATNRQGRGDAADRAVYEKIRAHWAELQKAADETYVYALVEDIARELARIHLPLSLYTEWYWKIDLKNMLDFLTLRSDSHAQWEIQQYSNVKAGIVNLLCPEAFQAWIDYRFGAVTFSRMEMNVLFNMRVGTLPDAVRANPRMTSYGKAPDDALADACRAEGMTTKREISEFMEKLQQPPEPPSFELDLSQAKTAEYFYERAKAAVPKL